MFIPHGVPKLELGRRLEDFPEMWGGGRGFLGAAGQTFGLSKIAKYGLNSINELTSFNLKKRTKNMFHFILFTYLLVIKTNCTLKKEK